jgi:hypothetical protein
MVLSSLFSYSQVYVRTPSPVSAPVLLLEPILYASGCFRRSTPLYR